MKLPHKWTDEPSHHLGLDRHLDVARASHPAEEAVDGGDRGCAVDDQYLHVAVGARLVTNGDEPDVAGHDPEGSGTILRISPWRREEAVIAEVGSPCDGDRREGGHPRQPGTAEPSSSRLANSEAGVPGSGRRSDHDHGTLGGDCASASAC